MKEINDQTTADSNVLKMQSNTLLSLAHDIFDEHFISLTSLAEFLSNREAESKKEKIEYETNAQNKIEKAEIKAEKWKTLLHQVSIH